MSAVCILAGIALASESPACPFFRLAQTVARHTVDCPGLYSVRIKCIQPKYCTAFFHVWGRLLSCLRAGAECFILSKTYLRLSEFWSNSSRLYSLVGSPRWWPTNLYARVGFAPQIFLQGLWARRSALIVPWSPPSHA